MTRIHVCPLSHVEAVLSASGATHAVSLLALRHRVPDFGALAPGRHLHLAVSDITVATESYILPEAEHIDRLLAFLNNWDRTAPLLLHCYAGVSRSTAGAFIALCALAPDVPETVHAAALRQASATATPNSRLVALADERLGRNGRMVAAVAAIGRGADCFAGEPFWLDIPLTDRRETPHGLEVRHTRMP